MQRGSHNKVSHLLGDGVLDVLDLQISTFVEYHMNFTKRKLPVSKSFVNLFFLLGICLCSNYLCKELA